MVMKKRLSDDRLPRCIVCRRMLYLTPEGECQNCRHLASMAATREQRRRQRRSDEASLIGSDDDPVPQGVD